VNFRYFKIPWPYLALIFAHLIWGANTVIAKITMQEIPVMSLSFLRFALASLLLVPFLITLERKHLKVKLDHLPKLLMASFLMITCTIALSYEGLKLTTAIDSSVLGLVVPIISVLGGWLVLKEHIYLINLLGIGIGLLGGLVIIGLPLLLFGGFAPTNLLGDLLIILSGFTFVAGTIVAKDILDKYPTLVFTAISFLVGVFSFAIPAVNEYIQSPSWVTNVTFLGILGLLYITILSSVCAFILMEWGLKKTSVIKANLFQYIEPAMAATLAVPILGERISYSFIIGTVLIVLGVYWGTLGKPHHYLLKHRHHRS